MAMSGSWRQINEYMYRDDSRSAPKRSMLREDLISGLISSPGFRPDFPDGLIAQFETKRKRESQGYAPETSRELLDWTIERVLIPQEEWGVLLLRIETDCEVAAQDILAPLKEKIVCIQPPGTETRVIIAMENAAIVRQALYGDDELLTIHPIMSDLGDDVLSGAIFKSYTFSDPGDVDQTRLRLVGEWLSFYGPISLVSARKKIGIEAKLLENIIDDLTESGSVLRGQFVAGTEEVQFCDKENFGVLLRMKRLAAVPSFDALPVSVLPFFIATIQGVVGRQGDKGQLYTHMEQLSCFGAPAAIWESEILPARLTSYDTSWLDTAMQESDLMWIGCGREKVYFCFQADLDMVRIEDDLPNKGRQDEVSHGNSDNQGHEADIQSFFPDEEARYDFGTLLRRSDMTASNLSQILWASVWQGVVTNDTVVCLRKGIENKFTVPEHFDGNQNKMTNRRRTRSPRHHRGFRNRFSKWKGTLPFSGYWRKIEQDIVESDLLVAAERTKERIRLLLERYGIIFRELLLKEQRVFQWRQLFRSLRLMELSGEIVSGYFFSDIPGPQFMSHSGFQVLQRLSPGQEVFWLNALDPASLCGIQVKMLKDTLPRRLAGTHLVYCGDRLVLVSQRNGQELTFHVNADDLDIQSYLMVLRHLISRQFKPFRQITVETINGMPAAQSPFVDALRVSFDVLIDYKQVVLYRKIEESSSSV